MAQQPTQYELQQSLAELPKIDLHRHLEGSLRLRSLMDIARQEQLDLPRQQEQLRQRVQMGDEQPKTLPNFLSKFHTLRQIYRSPEIIRRVVEEAIEDAAADHIRYLELRFTPAALAQARDFALGEVMDWVIEFAHAAAQAHGVRIGLIASVNRHEPVALAEQVVQLAIERGLQGIDLAGNEVDFPAEPFAGIFAMAQQEGLGTTVHAGEWTGAATVRHAVERMGASRIGHGVRVMEDPEMVRLARDRRAVFEVCLTSNLHSGVVERMDNHPLPRMIEAGLKVTLNTDDPGISNIRLSDEYFTAVAELGLSLDTLSGMILTAAQTAFLPPKQQRDVENELQAALGLSPAAD